MKKTVVTVAVLGALVLSTTTAYADTTNYTMESYTQEVLEDNFDLSQINDKLKDEEKEYKASLRISKAIEELTWKEFDDNYDDSVSRLNATKAKLYNHLKEGKEYHDKYAEYVNKKNEIILQAEENYYNYLNALKKLETRTANLRLAKEKYDAMVIEERIGQISKLDLMGYEKTYNDIHIEYLKAENLVEKARNTFNMFIDMPINTTIELADAEIKLPTYELTSLEQTLQSFIDNSYQNTSLKIELERLEMDRVIKGRNAGFGEVKIELEQNEIAVKETKEKLEDIVLNLEYQLRTKYNETMTAENVFKSAALKMEIEETNLNVAKVKQKNQMISTLDYIQCEQNYDAAVSAYLDAKLAAHTAIVSFNDFVEVNSTPVPMDLK